MSILGKVKKLFSDTPVILAVLVLFVVLSFAIPSFLTAKNITSILTQLSVFGIAGVGLTFVLIAGCMDLSIGATVSIAAIVGAKVMVELELGVFAGIACILLVGLLVGLANGFLVAKVRVNAFMCTLVMQMLLGGIALLLTNAKSIGGLPEGFLAIAQTTVLVPLPIYIMAAVFVVAYVAHRKMGFGKKLVATGMNAKAAQLIGIDTKKMIMVTYVISGLCASLAGIILAGRMKSASPGMDGDMILDVISAVILGGASLFGGKGSIIGTLFGVLLLGFISNGMNLLGVSPFTTPIVKGAIILLAVFSDAMQTRSRALSAR